MNLRMDLGKRIAILGLVSLMLFMPSCKKSYKSNYSQNSEANNNSEQFSQPMQTPFTEITSPTTKTCYYEYDGHIRDKNGNFYPFPKDGEIIRIWDEDRDDDGRYETTVINLDKIGEEKTNLINLLDNTKK